MIDKYCFSLVCAAELEEKLLDALLANFGNEIFISLPTFSHGTAPGRLSALEQVLGRSHSVYIQILLTTEETESLRCVLHADFAGTGIRYWASPLSIEGEVA
jgi:Protein of unknown function (DUF3240)